MATLTSVRHHQTSMHGIHPEAVAVAPRNAGDDRNEGYDDVKRDDDKSATNDEECYDGNANDEAIEFLLSEQSPEQELDVVDAVDDLDDLKPTFKRPRVDREETSPLTNVEMQRLLAKMCASDLRDPEICDGVGFTKFVVSLSGSSGAPCATAVRAELRNMRDAMRRSCGDASRRGPFALGLEKWRTAAGCWYYTLSLLTGGAVDCVERRSLCTWLETKKAHGPWQQAIAGLDMNQCQAVVVNFNAGNKRENNLETHRTFVHLQICILIKHNRCKPAVYVGVVSGLWETTPIAAYCALSAKCYSDNCQAHLDVL